MSFLLLRKIYYAILGLCYPIAYPLIYNNFGSVPKFGLEGNYILLSFDIDYKKDMDSIPELLIILDKLSIKASFAVIGMHVEKYPEVFEKILLNGHEILNHTYSHRNYWTVWSLPLHQRSFAPQGFSHWTEWSLPHQCSFAP